MPTIEEQAQIVLLIDDLLAKEQQAKEAAEGVLEQIDLIKKAILARAFRGELGTNDPTEESAQELMKKFCFKNSNRQIFSFCTRNNEKRGAHHSMDAPL